MFNSKAKTILVGIIGAGGFAREVMPFAKLYIEKLAVTAPQAKIETVFVETGASNAQINSHELISETDFISREADQKFFNVAIASSKDREEIEKRLIAQGCERITLIAPTIICYDNNIIGDGACICDNVTITSNAIIGKSFHANIYSYIAHDCEIGDYVTFAPRVCCNGNVKIENHAYIGTGAILKQGKRGQPLVIGEGAVVGMGAVVTKDVAPFTTVVGNPAKVMEKK